MRELTLAIVGMDFPNANGSNRRSEAMMTLPGEWVELVPEPRNRHDGNAVAVIGPSGVQLGYIAAERAPYVGARMNREDVSAIFQGMSHGRAFVRIRFGGGNPSLPPPIEEFAPSALSADQDEQAFYPDEDGPDTGA